MSRAANAGVTDHPIFVPTSEGPVGGIVSMPRQRPRAGVLLLPGYGRPGRSGVNSFWTRLARELAGHGNVVLRVDYAREGETFPIGEEAAAAGGGPIGKYRFEMLLLSQVLEWFRERLRGAELLVAGSCSGARAAIGLAGGEYRSAISRTFLVVPYLRRLVDPRDESRSDPSRSDGEFDDPDAVDPSVVEHLHAILGGAPCWLLAGGRDLIALDQLVRRLGPTHHELELEVVPNIALHFIDHPEVQAQVRGRMLDRIGRALTEPKPEAPAPSRIAGR
jgi:hypothetical protein